MNITIEQTDIEHSIEKHVRELIPGLSPETVVDISLAATRGPAGFTATIQLLTPEEANKRKSTSAAPAVTAPAEAAEPEKAVASSTPPAVKKVRTSGTKPLGIAQRAAEARKATTEPEPAVAEDVSAEAEDLTPTAEQIEENLQAAAELTAEADDIINDDVAAEEQAEEIAEDTPAKTKAVEEVPAPRQSLFSRLEKPQNQ